VIELWEDERVDPAKPHISARSCSNVPHGPCRRNGGAGRASSSATRVFANRDRPNETVRVEVLYFEGCPSHEALMARLPGLMARAGVDELIEFRAVESPRAAEQERFLGSPTLRIDGQDVEPAASQRSDFGLKCRMYPSAAGLRGAIPDEFVLDALTRAQDPRRADG
jgi:hypothetical protein